MNQSADWGRQSFQKLRWRQCFWITTSTVDGYPKDLNTFYAQTVPFPVRTHQNTNRPCCQVELREWFQGQQWPWNNFITLKTRQIFISVHVESEHWLFLRIKLFFLKKRLLPGSQLTHPAKDAERVHVFSFWILVLHSTLSQHVYVYVQVNLEGLKL